MFSVFLSFALVAAPTEQPTEKTKLAVMPLSHQRMDDDVVKILDEILLDEVAKLGQYQVIGSSDINAILGLEKMKDATGCDDVACAAEVGGALGAELLLSANVGRLGDNLVLSAKLIDITRAEVVARERSQVPQDERKYIGGITDLVAALFGRAVATTNAAAISDEEARAVAASGLAYQDWLVLQRFGRAGLERPAFDEFRQSGLSYEDWATSYRNRHESTAVEILKWVFTGSAVLTTILFINKASADGMDQSGALGISTGVASSIALGFWVGDLLTVAAPTQLPD